MSGVCEDQDAVVFQMDFGCVPCRSLVEPVWVLLRWIPGTVKPVEFRFVVGNPFFDRLPRRLDGFHGLDVEWRWRWARELDDAFPKARKAEEELDLPGAFDGTGGFHGSFAAGALERVAPQTLRMRSCQRGSAWGGRFVSWVPGRGEFRIGDLKLAI